MSCSEKFFDDSCKYLKYMVKIMLFFCSAKQWLASHDLDAAQVETAILIQGDRHLTQSDAALAIVKHLARPYRWLFILRYVPCSIRNTIYRWVARHRHALLKTPRLCQLPIDDERVLR